MPKFPLFYICFISLVSLNIFSIHAQNQKCPQIRFENRYNHIQINDMENIYTIEFELKGEIKEAKLIHSLNGVFKEAPITIEPIKPKDRRIFDQRSLWEANSIVFKLSLEQQDDAWIVVTDKFSKTWIFPLIKNAETQFQAPIAVQIRKIQKKIRSAQQAIQTEKQKRLQATQNAAQAILATLQAIQTAFQATQNATKNTADVKQAIKKLIETIEDTFKIVQKIIDDITSAKTFEEKKDLAKGLVKAVEDMMKAIANLEKFIEDKRVVDREFIAAVATLKKAFQDAKIAVSKLMKVIKTSTGKIETKKKEIANANANIAELKKGWIFIDKALSKPTDQKKDNLIKIRIKKGRGSIPIASIYSGDILRQYQAIFEFKGRIKQVTIKHKQKGMMKEEGIPLKLTKIQDNIYRADIINFNLDIENRDFAWLEIKTQSGKTIVKEIVKSSELQFEIKLTDYLWWTVSNGR